MLSVKLKMSSFGSFNISYLLKAIDSEVQSTETDRQTDRQTDIKKGRQT